MKKIVLFLLGEKGYQVLRIALSGRYVGMIEHVVIGEDPDVETDYADSIADLCRSENVSYSSRKDFNPSASFCERRLAVAAGWRWLITEGYKPLIVLHDSLLPRYRGFNPLVTALLNQDKYIGVTAIVATGDFDRGDIITSRTMKVRYPIRIANAITLISELYGEIAEEMLSHVKNGIPLQPKPQNEDEASYSVWRDEEDYRINWKWSAHYIAHFIRCVGHPYKGASTTIDGELVRIVGAEELEDVDVANRDVGKVLFFEGGGPVVICGAGLLKINEIRDEKGKSVLPFSKFRVRLK